MSDSVVLQEDRYGEKCLMSFFEGNIIWRIKVAALSMLKCSYLNCSKAFDLVFHTAFFKKNYTQAPLNRCYVN